MKIKPFYYLTLAVFLLVACGNPVTSQNEGKKSTNRQLKNAEIRPDLPPIYNAFEDITPLFEQQNDTTYVINFWSTWCAPCVKELPYFEELNAQYAPQKVKVLLISLDFPKQLETKLKPFLKKHNLQSELFVLTDPDANSWVNAVNPEWSGAIPATVIYKGAKKEFYEKSFEDLAELEAVVLPFL